MASGIEVASRRVRVAALLLIASLLAGPVSRPVGASAAIISDPTNYVLAAAPGGLLLLGYVIAFVVAGAILVARRDVK